MRAALVSAISGPRPWATDLSWVRNRVGVMLNARAKQVNSRVIRRLRQRVDETDLFVTHNLEEAESAVRALLRGGYDGIWLGGGDGTVTHGFNLLRKAQAEADFGRKLPPIGILALGTGNGLAHLVRSRHPERDLDASLFQKLETRVELPLVHVEAFEAPFGSIGYDARVLNDYARLLAQGQGWWAKSLAGYVAAVATRTIPAELGRPAPQFRVVARGQAAVVDRETKEERPLPANTTLYEGPARAVLFGTSPFYGYGLRALPQARRRADRFQVRVCTAPVLHLLQTLPQVWSGRTRSPHFHDFLVEGVTVECEGPEPTQVAGEAWGDRQRLELSLSSHRFPLMAPSGAVD